MLIKIIFNIEIKLLVKCKSYVTKVVGFDLRIPKHFSFHFYDLSTILYGIYKYAVFENKRKRKRTLAFRPLEVCFF